MNYETVDKQSPVITIYNAKLGKYQDMDIEEYLYGVLAGEMPSDFEIEALKAQAVAARTFVMYKQNQGASKKHPKAIVCTDYSDCQEYKSYEELKSINQKNSLEEKIDCLVNKHKVKKFALHTHPYVAAFIKSGIFPLDWKWKFKYSFGLKVVPNQSLSFLEYKFIDSDKNELDMTEEKEIK